jgi:hypothetical protein
MADDFSASFDPGSLEKLTQLMGFGVLLDPRITQALTDAGELLVTTAQTNTWTVFASPTGELAGSIYFYVVSPTEVDVAVGVPYGRRRELGFSGMTDSLGRHYTNDPGKPYLQPAVDTDAPMIQSMIEFAIYDAWGAI